MENTAPQPVVFIHDAAVDEYIATVLLTVMPGIELVGLIVVNADCIAQPAMDAASKLLQFLGREDIPLALSRARGWNPFPWPYRGDCVNFEAIPSLQPYASKVPCPPPSGEDLLVRLLEDALRGGRRLTVLITCPFTPLTDVLDAHPGLLQAIEKVVWMGGAIYVPGNLDPHHHQSRRGQQTRGMERFLGSFCGGKGLRSFCGHPDFPSGYHQ